MTIAASGPLRFSAISTEYGGTGARRLSQYRRGHASLYVRKNAADNQAVNHSAAVPETGPTRLGHFRGQGKGWTFTNSIVRLDQVDTPGTHYYCHQHYGADWLGANGANWPMYYINNNGIYSRSTTYVSVVIYARNTNGPFTFTNNSEIQGAGGVSNSAPGMHAVYIVNSVAGPNRPIVINNAAIRGGGGAGGRGGTGGTGGQGFYYSTGNEGPFYQTTSPAYHSRYVPSNNESFFNWNGPTVASPSGNKTSVVVGAYTYFRGAHRSTTSSPTQYRYEISRQWTVTNYVNGAGGGAGGNGGRGIGYNSPNQGGTAGAAGGNNGGNSGPGGAGGFGGSGASWGGTGQTGGTGAVGGSGNNTAGTGGAAGAAGGAPGYSIYAETPWGLVNNNLLDGPNGGGVAPS